MFHNPEQDSPACLGIDPELFYLEQNMQAASMHRQLKPICDSCPLLEQCREHALKHELYGYWAGMTANERQELRRRMGIVLERPELLFLAS